MDGDALYDEFGNYIGPDVDESDDYESEEEGAEERGMADGEEEAEDVDMDADAQDGPIEYVPTKSIASYEDKVYYKSAEEVYGKDVITIVEEEDNQTLETPIVAPEKKNPLLYHHARDVAGEGETSFENSFVGGLQKLPERVRNIALVGALHHGKTLFSDLLLRHSEGDFMDLAALSFDKAMDNRRDEQHMKIGIKANAASVVLGNYVKDGGKHYLFNFLDTPGHTNFYDEAIAALRLCDGAILVVDAAEGVINHTCTLLSMLVKNGIPTVLLLNKIDRLILELRMPPNDAYMKMRYIIDTLNEVIDTCPVGTGIKRMRKFSPLRENVLFASALHGWCFTLQSFAKIYADWLREDSEEAKPSLIPHGTEITPEFLLTVGHNKEHEAFDPEKFAKRLWGEAYYDRHSGKFFSKGVDSLSLRTFVEFILEPLYKVYSHILVLQGKELKNFVERELRIYIRKEELHLDVSPLLKVVMGRFLGRTDGFVSALIKAVPSPRDGAMAKLSMCYNGPFDGFYGKAIARCECGDDENETPLLVHISKMINKEDGKHFDCLGRVFSGTLRPGMSIAVLGESYSEFDDDEISYVRIGRLFLPAPRSEIQIDCAHAGSLVLIEGIDEYVSKTATLVAETALSRRMPERDARFVVDDLDEDDEAAPAPEYVDYKPHTFKPLNFGIESIFKVAVEPLNPAELPKMLEGLRMINKSYPMAITRKEENGEHTIFGSGEVYMDCVMRDLREVYSGIEIKVSDPYVSFCETVIESSIIKCYATTPNKKNKLSVTAEPLEDGLPRAIELKDVDLSWKKKDIVSFFQEKYGWDALEARSLWAFGPGENGPNVFIDDTLSEEGVDRALVSDVRDFIIQGFQWGTREGPLCEEPIRGVKFKLIGAEIAPQEMAHSGVQIIPTARRVCYSAFLSATPRLMEPIYLVEIMAPQQCVDIILNLIQRRRGKYEGDMRLAGTPFLLMRVFMPVIDSFGFEIDLRSFTQGQAFCQSYFDHWDCVPGDPCDKSIVLHPLEKSPLASLAREFMMKTRRRKGLSEDVSAAKFFDEELHEVLPQVLPF